MSFDNVIDATDVFMSKKIDKDFDMSTNLGNNRAFRAYCECIGQLTMGILSKSDFYDAEIDDNMINFPSSEIVDVSMNEPVTVTAQKLAEEIMQECDGAGIKISIDSIMFRKIIVGKVPERVSLTMRMGSRNA
jgi:hypothetical protein